MPKIRVYEISKELGFSNKEVIAVAKKIGLQLKNHTSSVSKMEADKIKEMLRGPSSNGDLTTDLDKDKQKERVTVFKSESGDEVVERRTGSRVVLRRRKKVKTEPDKADTETIDDAVETKKEDTVLEKQEDIKTVDTDKVVEKTDEEPQEAKVEDAEKEFVEEVKAEPVAEPEIKDEVEDQTVQQVEPITTETVVEAKSIEVDTEIDISKEKPKESKKKKGKKVRPKKEEIIDEDTLEELRKAFRTKLPTKKREYVIDDRKPKIRQNFDKRKKTNDRSAAQVFNKTEVGGATEVIQPTVPSAKRLIKIGEKITVGELAKLMGIKAGEVIKKLILLGTPATINQFIDHDTALLLASEFEYEVELIKFDENVLLINKEELDSAEKFSRPPVVTVMGHVDHGKTTLLDTIREANVVEGEAGGITQHIGAYKVNVDDKVIVFVDTPGHEAFTSMRARGASITDIVILVVAADDGVMPQTIEAINHAKAAEVPIIVAINKIDKEGADAEKLKRQLSEAGLIAEEWGGDTLFAEVSAKNKIGINNLLEIVLLQADVLELESPVDIRANGVVLEAKLDKGRGVLATLIVKEGTLNVGDYVLSGLNSGKVRALIDDTGKKINSSGPSIPVEIMGLSTVPEAGDKFYVVKDERTAREIISNRQYENRIEDSDVGPKISLDYFFESLDKEEVKELLLIIKADTQGSAEALKESIEKLSTDKCKVNIVHTAVGGINKTDIALASASNAIVLGFNVRPDKKAIDCAEREGVSIELHSIIYDVVNRIKNSMEGLLEPILKEIVTGHVEVRETFHISRIGTIAGCYVSDGKVNRDDNLRVLRDGVVLFNGKISSLKRFKDDAKEVQSGYECGMSIENYNDIKVGDIFELYSFEEIRQEL